MLIGQDWSHVLGAGGWVNLSQITRRNPREEGIPKGPEVKKGGFAKQAQRHQGRDQGCHCTPGVSELCGHRLREGTGAYWEPRDCANHQELFH